MQHDDHSPDAGDSPVAPPLERRHDEAAAFDASGMLSTGRWMWEWIKVLSVTIVFILGVRAFVVEAFKIPTGSMENTLLVGDFLLVNKAVYGAEIPIAGARLPAFTDPTRGDVVVFFPPHAPDKNFVKRIVGMPGDTLEMRGKVLYRDGVPQDEPYARHLDPVTDPGDPRMMWQRDYLTESWPVWEEYRPTRDNWGPLVVPPGHFFALGDNRDSSEDSRHWGFVEAESVRGRPMFVYYSFQRDLTHPFSWLTGIRWARIGDVIR